MDIEPQKNKTEPIAIWSITPNGKVLAQNIQNVLKGSVLFASVKIWGGNQLDKDTFTFEKLSKEIHQQFNKFRGHVFIFSTGIAVRIIAPLLESKTIDPAVVVVDDNGNYAISLISGHLGGANALTKKIAAIINATPVITTATDTNLLPSIDLIAKDGHLYIETPQNIKVINMAFLTGKPVNLYDPFGFIKKKLTKTFWTNKNQKDGATGKIFCSCEAKDVSRETLILRPPVLSVGIGCNRGTSCEKLKQFLFMVFKKEGLSVNSICRFATINIKKDETGLLALSKAMKIQIDFYDKKKLNSVKTIMTPSKMAEKHLGVKSVCEAAAILSAGSGKLIVPKKKNKDVTIAVAIKT
ncbi:cobalt-precorrin 5A hydrolase [Desulfobacula sp.]|uniref:cobalt-precorrin 5A hydrolase n=1 Tax=Desulfobacula sp. TaxID=2593537 RepID=UPI002607D501|nr:cobalt-precorrin 5A hydrolase [Desulfobacula sp.]